jgi:transposase
MMVFGVDPHKQTHTAVAVDELGRRTAERTVRTRRDGHLQLLVWADTLTGTDRIWAVEDVRHVAGNLVRDLLAAGEKVICVLTAAKLLGEIGDMRRFGTTAAFARHNGTAPIPVWSGTTEVHRLNRAGNRQLNAAIHRIALTQSRCHPGARQLLERRQQTSHDTAKGSLRVLKRHPGARRQGDGQGDRQGVDERDSHPLRDPRSAQRLRTGNPVQRKAPGRAGDGSGASE